MKYKDWRKIGPNIRAKQIKDYCDANDIDYNDYIKTENRISNTIIGVGLGLCAFVIAIGCIASCTVKPPKVTVPVYNEKALRFEEPLRALSDNSISVSNQSGEDIYYELQGEYSTYIQPYSNSNIYLSSPQQNRTMTFSVSSERDIYYLSDDGNFRGYSDEFYTSEEAWNGTFINFYSALGNKIYLDTHLCDIDNIYTTWLNGELMNTGVSRRLTKTYKVMYGNGTFSLNFNREYINHYNTFNSLKVVSSVDLDNFTYYYTNRIYAFNSNNNSQVLISANTSSTNASVTTNGNNLDVVIPQDAKYQQMDYYLAPYLEDNSLTCDNSSRFDLSSNYGLRSWLSNDKTSFKFIRINETTTSSLDLWANFGDLFLVMWTALVPIFSIQVLPMVTIGGLMIAPLILGFIALLLALVKK